MASRWRHCADLTGPGIEAQTSRTESERFATELTAGLLRFVGFVIVLVNNIRLIFVLNTLQMAQDAGKVYGNVRLISTMELRWIVTLRTV